MGISHSHFCFEERSSFLLPGLFPIQTSARLSSVFSLALVFLTKTDKLLSLTSSRVHAAQPLPYLYNPYPPVLPVRPSTTAAAAGHWLLQMQIFEQLFFANVCDFLSLLSRFGPCQNWIMLQLWAKSPVRMKWINEWNEVRRGAEAQWSVGHKLNGFHPQFSFPIRINYSPLLKTI